MKPRLSILLPAMKGYDSVAAAVDSWEAQTCRESLEILILCPDELGPSAAQAAELTAGQVIVYTGRADLHEARALGIQAASGEYTMLAEDHCLPDPDWAEAILARLDEGWDAVGPVLRAGNRTSCWAQGSFLIGYGEWMMPAKSGPTDILCGWNVTIRTRLLRERGSELAEEMLLGAFLVRRLHAEGARFYLENQSRMRHFDPSGCAYEMLLLLIVGLGFGAMRTRHWHWALRMLYPLAAPAVALLHGKRALVQYRRAGTAAGMQLTDLAATAVLASAWGLGEAVGAVMGTRKVAPYLWRTEVKPVTRADVARSSALEDGAGGRLPASSVESDRRLAQSEAEER